MQLADTSINQNHARHLLLFPLYPLVSPRDYFAHRSKIVHACHASNDELAIVGLLYLSILPNHHGSDSLGSLDMGDIETLDSLRQLGQHQRVLYSLLDSPGRRLHHTKTLIERLLGVLPY